MLRVAEFHIARYEQFHRSYLLYIVDNMDKSNSCFYEIHVPIRNTKPYQAHGASLIEVQDKYL